MADFLQERLGSIRTAGSYRALAGTVGGADFWSNDYLGLARSTQLLGGDGAQVQGKVEGALSGATGSRSISGDADVYHELERRIAGFHGYPAALVFNSGYTANLGLLSAILKRGDTILYDELMHASCRDGIRLGFARAVKFPHNDLEETLIRTRLNERMNGQVFVLTEGRFSMDGDVAPLRRMASLCREYAAHLIVDEAHSGGLDGQQGRGLVSELGLEAEVFAMVITYGKAFGAHGAAVLGSAALPLRWCRAGGINERPASIDEVLPQGGRAKHRCSAALREYLINTCRPFIYTTGPAPTQWQGIAEAYAKMEALHERRYDQLREVINTFHRAMGLAGLGGGSPFNHGPIQTVHFPGNDAVMAAEAACRKAGLLVKGIRSPTVAAGSERLRVCLHSFNTEDEVVMLADLIKNV